jgi:hypothetical protein
MAAEVPMPLRDHFHPPLADRPPWEAVATMWTSALVRWLNRTLPRGEYVAYPTVHLGPHVEADVAEYEVGGGAGRNGAVATLPAAPPAAFTVPAVFPDDIEVRVGTSRHELNLVAVIELVSPSNNKADAERRAFVAKCASYLNRGVGVVVVDVVTSRRANLHNQLLEAIGGAAPPGMADTPAYLAGYRPVHRRAGGGNDIEVWPYPVAVGDDLPAVPLALRGGPVLPVDFEATYTAVLEDLNL